MRNEENLRKVKKGQVLNPKGSEKGPRGYHLKTIMKKILERKIELDGIQMPAGQALALTLFKKGMEGDVNAIKEIWNRVGGLPQQEVTIISEYKEKVDVELLRKFNIEIEGNGKEVEE